MIGSDSKTTEMRTYATSPYSKNKCLTMLRDAYGPRARIFQRPGLMRLMVDQKAYVQVEGPHEGLPWALVVAAYNRLGFEVVIEQGRPMLKVKERVQNENVSSMPTTEAGDGLRAPEGEAPKEQVQEVQKQKPVLF